MVLEDEFKKMTDSQVKYVVNELGDNMKIALLVMILENDCSDKIFKGLPILKQITVEGLIHNSISFMSGQTCKSLQKSVRAEVEELLKRHRVALLFE